MKILVCGGRHYNDLKKVYETLDNIHATLGPITTVIHGDATGADSCGKRWAEQKGIPQVPYPYLSEHGKRGGVIRNSQMLNQNPDIDLVVAFPGNTGTKDMIQKAKDRNIAVEEVLC